MEIPIQVAVRIRPNCSVEPPAVLSVLPMPADDNTSIQYIQAGEQLFPVSFSMAPDVSQGELFNTAVNPMLLTLLEGFDVSAVTYGQTNTGKTYTMMGPTLSENEYGIIPRSIIEIFSYLGNKPERNYIMNISWYQINDKDIKDLFGDVSYNIQIHSVIDAFRWLQIGHNNISKSQDKGHLLFTLTIEQQWVNSEGYVQHKMSTMSFCDLVGTERILSMSEVGDEIYICKDLGLRCLETIITTLSDPVISKLNSPHLVPYDKSTLTALMRDSFGGRARTLFICCVSSDEEFLNETLCNLQVASRAQNVWNYVVENAFSDNNTPCDILQQDNPENMHVSRKTIDSFGIQFAASQWLKLVANAEGLFSRLKCNKNVNPQDMKQIDEWLFLKQECEDCLSSEEGIRSVLGPIAEEQSLSSSDDSQSDRTNNNDPIDTSEMDINLTSTGLETSEGISDTECVETSDWDNQRVQDLPQKVDALLSKFRQATCQLASDNYEQFLHSQPKSALGSFVSPGASVDMDVSLPVNGRSSAGNQDSSIDGPLLRGRRRSVQPGHCLSSLELQFLQLAAGSDAESIASPSTTVKPKEKTSRSKVEIAEKRLETILKDIEATKKQISELKQTMSLKTQIIQDLIKSNDSRATAKQRCSKKKSKLEVDLEKAKINLAKAKCILAEHNGAEQRADVDKWRSLMIHYEQRLRDVQDIAVIAGASAQQLKSLQVSLQDSKKQMEVLQKRCKKDEKTKLNLEKELKAERKNEMNKKPDKQTLRDVTARISHLDQVLKEKSQLLSRANDTVEQQAVRLEIRNLRKTRDILQEQRSRLKSLHGLDCTQQRRLLECDEAIEAIDTAIEVKNERICGRSSVIEGGSRLKDEGERMLMERLNKLSLTETRTLLYKYFLKVIDHRESGRCLEMQNLKLESELEASEWREHALKNALRQTRLEGERKVVHLQQQHEQSLDALLRHMAEDTSASSNTDRERYVAKPLSQPDNYNIYHPGSSKIKSRSTYCKDVGIYSDRTVEKYKHPQTREPKNKLLVRIKDLTRMRDLIPSQNLKQLQSSAGPTVKVTREKNKIIFQQDKD